jgi:hypothetical protein
MIESVSVTMYCNMSVHYDKPLSLKATGYFAI